MIPSTKTLGVSLGKSTSASTPRLRSSSITSILPLAIVVLPAVLVMLPTRMTRWPLPFQTNSSYTISVDSTQPGGGRARACR